MRSLLNDAEYREPAELGEGHQRAIGPEHIEGHGSSQEPVNVVREVGDRRILDHVEDEEMLIKGSGMRLGAAQKRAAAPGGTDQPRRVGTGIKRIGVPTAGAEKQ